jgi:hypothetical protein
MGEMKPKLVYKELTCKFKLECTWLWREYSYDMHSGMGEKTGAY